MSTTQSTQKLASSELIIIMTTKCFRGREGYSTFISYSRDTPSNICLLIRLAWAGVAGRDNKSHTALKNNYEQFKKVSPPLR